MFLGIIVYIHSPHTYVRDQIDYFRVTERLGKTIFYCVAEVGKIKAHFKMYIYYQHILLNSY